MEGMTFGLGPMSHFLGAIKNLDQGQAYRYSTYDVLNFYFFMISNPLFLLLLLKYHLVRRFSIIRPGMMSHDVDDRMRDIDERAFPPNAPLRDVRPMNPGAPSPNIPHSQVPF